MRFSPRQTHAAGAFQARGLPFEPFGLTALVLAAVLMLPGLVRAQNAAEPSLAVPQNEASSGTGSHESQDAVSRFLADRGITSGRPVAEIAQHVRERAADLASDLVISAMDFLGVPYKRGGQSKESGFDCSGFTRHVFERSIGLVLPRRAAEQANMPGLERVAQSELKPGDLVFFNTLRHTFSHVGIYIGDNKFIHSPRPGAQVRVEDMGVPYWSSRFDGARRVLQPVVQASEMQ